MNLYENAATEAIVLLFKKGKLWQKELVFDFLLKPFGKCFSDIDNITSQDTMKGTIPDFTIELKNKAKIKYEVKINDVGLTDSEKRGKTRNAFLVKEGYAHLNEIRKEIRDSGHVLFWDQLFKLIDEKEATNEFEILDLVRHSMFGNVTNKDYEFLSKFLYSEEVIKVQLKETLKDLMHLIVSDEKYINEVADTPYIEKGKNKLSLKYDFGDQYKLGSFCLEINGKNTPITVENTSFIKPYDRVLYFYNKVSPLLKSNENLLRGLIKKENAIDETISKKAENNNISPNFIEQIQQKISDNYLKPELINIFSTGKNKIKERELYMFNFSEKYPRIIIEKIFFEQFSIAFEITNENKMQYGLFCSEGNGKDLIKKCNLKKQFQDDWKTTQWWAAYKELPFDNYKKWTVETFFKIKQNPAEFAGIIKEKYIEIIDKLKAADMI